MPQALKSYLPGLTLFGLLFGLFLGFSVGNRTLAPRNLSETDFIREVERGARMNIVVQYEGLNDWVEHRDKLTKKVELDEPIVLPDSRTLPAKLIRITIPDANAQPLIGCDKGNKSFFVGEVGHKAEAFVSVRHNDSSDGHAGAIVSAMGALYVCGAENSKNQIARGIQLLIRLDDGGRGCCEFASVTALHTYFDFAGNIFVTFLLMLFIPTLGLALVRAVLDSAGVARRFAPAFRFFLMSSVVAASIGLASGVIFGHVWLDLTKDRLQTLSQGIGARPEAVTYDPHPLLTQLGHIVPANPLGALSDPNGNSGLQIAFIAVVLGAVLASLSSGTRRQISESLQKTLALFVRDQELGYKAISDYAEWVAPIGVFFLALSTGAKTDMTQLRDLGKFVSATLVSLFLFVVLLVLWLRFFRDWHNWFNQGLKPAMEGLMTAFGTSSSYSALPQINSMPLLTGDSIKRGALDFGITLNKPGTALYVGAASGLLLDRFGTIDFSSVLLAILLSVLASIACAGLPFAAIFALRMVLVTSAVPGGLAWLILPVDPVLDRFVTVVNVFSNISACSDPRISKRRVIQRPLKEEVKMTV